MVAIAARQATAIVNVTAVLMIMIDILSGYSCRIAAYQCPRGLR